MNILLKELGKRNFQIKIEMNYRGRNETFAIQDGQKIQFELRETLKMNKVKIDKSSHPWRQSNYEQVFIPTGELRLEIKNVYGGNFGKILRDQINHALEKQLNDFIINIYKSLNYLNINDKEWEEERRLTEEKEQRHKIKSEQKRLEKEKTKDFFQLAKRYNKANIIRNFVKELEKKLIEGNALTEEREKWVQWALKKVDSLDPMIEINELNLNDSD